MGSPVKARPTLVRPAWQLTSDDILPKRHSYIRLWLFARWSIRMENKEASMPIRLRRFLRVSRAQERVDLLRGYWP